MGSSIKKLLQGVKTPCYIIDKQKLISNLEILKEIKDKTKCKILLASKCFSMYSLYPLIGQYLDGICASGINEARLGYEYMKKEVHTFSPAFIPDDFDSIVKYSNHIVFNSFNQLNLYKDRVKNLSVGIRINPQFSTQEHGIYDPCAEGSRLGVTIEEFKKNNFDNIDGLHFHTLCEQDFAPLEATINVIENKFGEYLPKLKWLNFGGGHHITRKDYDRNGLIKLINRIQDKYGLTVILEPGEAVALDAGYLVSSVLDFNRNNNIINCILDTSAACHMPDVLEMPYHPRVINERKDGKFTYRFGGPTCLSGDIIGDYSFDNELKIGDKIIFEDMAIYTMVKNNTFNGMNLPDISIKDGTEISIIKRFGYEDFKSRL